MNECLEGQASCGSTVGISITAGGRDNWCIQKTRCEGKGAPFDTDTGPLGTESREEYVVM